MAGSDDVMRRLRASVLRQVGDNMAPLAQQALGRGPNGVPLPPQKQWWNLPAKLVAANRISAEEYDRAIRLAPNRNPHNGPYDAVRHARASNRVATEIDPLSARIFGDAHEVQNLGEALGRNLGQHWYGSDVESLPQAVAEMIMDRHNNAEGRKAAREGRPIDPKRLVTRPISPGSYRAESPEPSRYSSHSRYPPYK